MGKVISPDRNLLREIVNVALSELFKRMGFLFPFRISRFVDEFCKSLWIAACFSFCFSTGAVYAETVQASKWNLPDAEGRMVHSEEFKGKTILLVFWTTWCPDCLAELPTLVALQSKYSSRNFLVIGVCVDSGDRDTVQKFVVSRGLTFPVVIGDDMTKLSYGGIKGFPTAFVIDSAGNIVDTFATTHPFSQADAEMAILPLLGGAVGSPAAVGVSSAPLPATVGEAAPETILADATGVVSSNSVSGGGIRHFDGGPVSLKNRTRMDDYDFSLKDEKYFLYVPKSYDGQQPFGLLAFIGASPNVELPGGWDSVLERRRILYIAAQNVGNDQRMERRAAVTLAGIYRMMDEYKVDPSRVYVSGISGGARMSVIVAFYHPELFAGLIPICGADYYHGVPKIEATRQDSYGVNKYDIALVGKAKQTERLAVVTGEKDWRRGNILDIYKGAYLKEGFQAKLWDVPGMGHEVCSSDILDQALDFIEDKSKSADAAATAP